MVGDCIINLVLPEKPRFRLSTSVILLDLARRSLSSCSVSPSSRQGLSAEPGPDSVVDAMYQGMAYWIMGCITNDAFRLARNAGVYKCIQAAGSAISFGVDASGTPLLNEQVACMAMVLFALFPAGYVVYRVTDTNVIMEPSINVEDAKAIHEAEEEKKQGHPVEVKVDDSIQRIHV